MSARPIIGLALLVFAILFAIGCEAGATEIVVRVSSDLSVPGELDQVRIEVDGRAIGGALVERTAEVRGVDSLPVTMGLLHGGGALGPIEVVAVARQGGADDVRREARLSFIMGRTVVLELGLDRACRGMVCPDDETCAAGECRPILVRPEELLPWVADAGAGCGTEVCNGEDDDCDGTADEGFVLTSDARHCGACNRVCPIVGPNASGGACVAAVCELTCDSGFGNCDGDPGNGCEENLETSSAHCGVCANTCDRFGAINECAMGSCRMTNCEPGFNDCDMDFDTGCESQLRDLANCGGCGIPCELFGATESCGMGSCELVSCDPGFDNCDGRIENGCEVESSTDVFNCGGCGRACSADAPHSSDVCVDGGCGIACHPGWGDCDANPDTGCEASLSDPSQCGDCSTRCSGVTFLCSGDATTGYACIPPPCAFPPTRCGATCVDIDINPLHCGGCDVVCPTRANSAPTCTGGGCGLACDPGWGDCDGVPSNGCEAPLNTVANCGTCGVVCTSPTGSASCTSGRCIIVGCDPMFETAWFEDADGDSYGNPAVRMLACSAPLGYVPDAMDCADAPVADPACNGLGGALCNPGLAGADLCDGADNDCDSTIDEDDVVDASCGVGLCRTTNMPSSCTAGVLTACIPGSPVSEGPVCAASCGDTTDNDCDGLTDALDSGCSGQVRRRLTLLNGAQTVSLVSFPVLVELRPATFGYAIAQDAGEDLRFVDADGVTALPHEIERWSEGGTSYVWVRVPRIDALSDTDFIWMYYGNPLAADRQDPPAVWSNGYEAVYHLSDFRDSTGRLPAGSNMGTTAASGGIGGARDFDATDYIALGPSRPLLRSLPRWTLSARIRSTDLSPNQGVVSVSNFNGGTPTSSSRASLQLQSARLRGGARSIDGEAQQTSDSTGGLLTTGRWYCVAATTDYPANQIRVFIDGAPRGTASVSFMAGNSEPSPPAVSSIGAQDDGTGQHFRGTIDEVRISAVARSPSWINAECLSETGAFVVVGPEEPAVPPVCP